MFEMQKLDAAIRQFEARVASQEKMSGDYIALESIALIKAQRDALASAMRRIEQLENHTRISSWVGSTGRSGA